LARKRILLERMNKMNKLYRNSLELARDTIMSLSSGPGVSGYEHTMDSRIESTFGCLPGKPEKDFMGNTYIHKTGTNSNQSVMLAAHVDEIGLMITFIDESGFVHFTTVGGIDQRTLLNQEVVIHGRKDMPGIISFVPSSPKNRNSKKALTVQELVIDIGYSHTEAREVISPGDIISIKRDPVMMMNGKIAGKAMDNRAGVTVLAVCLNELGRIVHRHNVIAVLTAQEEVGLRGAITSTDKTEPNIAVAVDVTHAQTPDTKAQVKTQLGKGPVITIGPNIHPEIFKGMQKSAKENRIPFQIQPSAGPTGTDARVIQLAGYGIPVGLISIPLRYMHTSVETVSLQDIVDSGKLLACYIASLPEDLEELSCF